MHRLLRGAHKNPLLVLGCVPQWQDKILLCRRAIEARLGYIRRQRSGAVRGMVVAGAKLECGRRCHNPSEDLMLGATRADARELNPLARGALAHKANYNGNVSPEPSA